MVRRRRNPSQRLAAQSVELAFAAPQVVMHRLARMASAGASPSARDRREFTRMGSEKVLAFYQSGAAFWSQVWRMQLQWSQSLMAIGLALMFGARPRGPSSRAVRNAAARLASAGLAPLHVTAVANARRLGRPTGRTMRRP
jgi:hypothetical protein